MIINYLDLEAKFREKDNNWAIEKLQEWATYESLKSQKDNKTQLNYDWIFGKK